MKITKTDTPLPSERKDFSDPHTGRRMIRWTSSPALDRHLYFTSPSVTADDRWLVFLSERDGHPNFFAIHRESGSIHRLTANSEGSLRSYVYPSDNRSGIGKSSPSLDPRRNILYYIHGQAVWRIGLDERAPDRLFVLPRGWWTAFSHVSADGRWLCVPCAPPEAFPPGQTTQWEQLDTVPSQFSENSLSSRVYLIDTQTGEGRVLAEVPFWVSHVNFAPDNSGRLVMNSEGAVKYQHLNPRIWCLEADGSFRPLFDQPPGMCVNHENWAESENWIIYHGSQDKEGFVAARDWSGKLIYKYGLGGISVGHATPMKNPRQCVVDRAEAISVVEPDENGNALITDLCLHHASPKSWGNQDTHLHPLQTPDGGGVVFSSDRDSVCDVYEVRLDPAD